MNHVKMIKTFFRIHFVKLFKMTKLNQFSILYFNKKHIISVIEGFECVPPCHGFDENVVRHKYYVTNKVIEYFSKLDGWKD